MSSPTGRMSLRESGNHAIRSSPTRRSVEKWSEPSTGRPVEPAPGQDEAAHAPPGAGERHHERLVVEEGKPRPVGRPGKSRVTSAGHARDAPRLAALRRNDVHARVAEEGDQLSVRRPL